MSGFELRLAAVIDHAHAAVMADAHMTMATKILGGSSDCAEWTFQFVDSKHVERGTTSAAVEEYVRTLAMGVTPDKLGESR